MSEPTQKSEGTESGNEESGAKQEQESEDKSLEVTYGFDIIEPMPLADLQYHPFHD